MNAQAVWDTERLPVLSTLGVESDLDVQLIEALTEDGRITNSALGRRFGVSEALVRQRLKRLLSAGAIRYHAVADLRSLGMSHIALLKVAVRPEFYDEVLELMKNLDGISALFVLSGADTFMTYTITQDVAATQRLLDEHLRPHPGVVRLTIDTIVSATKFDGSSGFVLASDIPAEDEE